MPRKSFAETMRSWQKMLDQSRPLLADNPDLAPSHAELEGFLADAQRLNDRVGELTAERKQTVRLCQEAVQAGVEARMRMAGLLIGRLGPRNEELTSFGVHPQPRTLRRRSKTAPEQSQDRPDPAPKAPKAP